MSLFTDGILSQESDLQNWESSILNVAVLEGVDTGAKRELAQEDIASQVKLFLLRDPWLDPMRLTRRTKGLCDVVASKALSRWHTELSIAMIYSDAYGNQLNDRYLAKLTQYQSLAHESSLRYFLDGVGLVYDPIPKATCVALTSVSGEASSESYYFAVAWLNAKGQEGAVSDITGVTTSAGSVPMLTVTAVPQNAQGWSIYASTDPKSLAQQYSGNLPTPLTWTLPVTGLISGSPPTNGQAPELFVVNQSRIQRG